MSEGMLVPDGWKKYTLKQLADKNDRYSFTGGPFGSNLKVDDYTENGIRIIQLQNIGDGKFLNNYKIFTSTEKADELLSCNIYPDDIILSKMGDPVARATIIPSISPRYVMASDGIRLAIDRDYFDNHFVLNAINFPSFRDQAETNSTGTTRKRIGLSELRELVLVAPPLSEQRKIASILTSVDDVIEKTEAQISKLQDLKKGMMTELLTKGIGHTEFKDSPVGRIPVEWKVKSLDEVTKIIDCKHRTPIYSDTGFPVIRPRNIVEGDINLAGCLNTNQAEYEDLIENHKPSIGDIVYSRNATFGIGAYVNKDIDFAIGQDVCIIHPIKIDSMFLYHLINSPVVRLQVDNLCAGSTFKRINLASIRGFNIPIPPINEQAKISMILISQNNLINNASLKLSQTKALKKALMNDLLTGKKRVTVD